MLRKSENGQYLRPMNVRISRSDLSAGVKQKNCKICGDRFRNKSEAQVLPPKAMKMLNLKPTIISV